jgi:RNA polymerase sigma-70 factor (ECF subfamily)
MRGQVSVDDPAEMLEQARRGSAHAFTQIVRHYQSRVRAFLGRFVRGADVVEDLAQDTFVRAYRSLAQFRGDSSLGVWLLGIARNLALMHLREEARRRAKESDVLRAALARWLAEPAERAVGAEEDRALQALEACLDALPEHSAELVDGYYFKGRTTAELARAAGKKEGALGMMLLRIREILRRCIRGRLAGAEAGA